MKNKILNILLLAFLSGASFAQTYSIKHRTAGQIEEILKENKVAHHEEKILAIEEILQKEEAIQLFSEMMVDLCLNPNKYDFPIEPKNKGECRYDLVVTQVANDLAFATVDNDQLEKDAVKIEKFLNEFLNSYLDKMRSAIQAFSAW